MGENKFDEMLRQLEAAKHFIFMEYFIVSEGLMWGKVLEILAKKAAEGVDVRIMYDGTCEFALLPRDYPKRLNVFCVSFMTVLVFHPVLAEKIILTGMDWLEKLHLMKKKQSRREKFQASMEVYRETAAYLKDHKRVIVSVILITFIQRLALFAVTWMVYLAFRLEGTPMWDVVLLQAVISVSVDMLPLPGGMGISESLFLKIFTTVFASVTLPAMVLSRGLGYYSQLLISALFTIVAQLYYSVHKSKVPHRCSTLDTEE